jgi:hypothetical protein
MVEVEGETTPIAVGQRLTATKADLLLREQTMEATASGSTSRPPSDPPAKSCVGFCCSGAFKTRLWISNRQRRNGDWGKGWTVAGQRALENLHTGFVDDDDDFLPVADFTKRSHQQVSMATTTGV